LSEDKGQKKSLPTTGAVVRETVSTASAEEKKKDKKE